MMMMKLAGIEVEIFRLKNEEENGRNENWRKLEWKF
jgi:hypothetical protein